MGKRRTSTGGLKVGQYLLSFLFIFVGCAGSYALVFKPLLGSIAARSWMTVPCHVSKLDRNFGPHSEGIEEIAMSYSYQIDGKDYRSNRYNFDRNSVYTSTLGSSLRRYSSGSDASCYVNPQVPSESVIDRKVTPVIWLRLLVFMVIAGFGLRGLVCLHRGGRPFRWQWEKSGGAKNWT